MRSLPARVSILAAALLLAGCGRTPSEPKGPSMTPEQTMRDLTAAVAKVAAAASPVGKAEVGDPDPNVPCGGVEGNDYTKISGTVDAGPAGDVADIEAAVDKAYQAAEKLGYKPKREKGDGLALRFGFGGDGWTAIVTVDKTLVISGQTACLPNPNSADPFPDVQPRPSASQ